MDAKLQNIYGGYTNPSYSSYDKYYHQYLTIEILEGGEIYLYGVTYSDSTEEKVYYSKNNGAWTQRPDTIETISVSKNDIIRLKSTVDTSKDIEWGGWVGNDSDSATAFNIYGNIMSMFYGDDFANNPEINITPTSYSPFREMFYEAKVRDASNLCMPSTILCQGMYSGCFGYSTITHAPKLIPAHLSEKCYFGMFDSCENLQGQIIIPTPLSCPECHYTDSPYYQMFIDTFIEPQEGDIWCNANVEILALMNKQVSLEYMYHIFDQAAMIQKIKIVLPWEGIKNDDSTGFSAELKYFDYENHAQQIDNIGSVWKTEFTMSEDGFGHTLDIKNPVKLMNCLHGYNDYLNVGFDPESYEIIEPLQYFLSTPLTFETIDPCEFKWYDAIYNIDMGFLEYSINDSSWQKYTKGIIIPANTKISWRASRDITNDSTLSGLSFSLGTNGAKLAGVDTTTKRFNVYGNIMSLLSPNFEGLDTIPWDKCFGYYETSTTDISAYGLFAETQVQSAENLILPAINLTNGCYAGMFIGSTLIIAPRILPVKNPRNLYYCYAGMFENCTKLQTIPILMLATTFDPPEGGIRSGNGEQSFSTCIGLAARMYYGCTSLSVIPEIHICYIDTSINTGRGQPLFFKMFNQSSIRQIKLFSHSSTPGYYYAAVNHGGEFKNFVDSNIGCTIYCYDKFLDQAKDLNLSSTTTIEGNSIINIHENSVPEPSPEDDKSKFYIQHNDSKYEFEKTYESMTWGQLVGNNKSIKLGSKEYSIRYTGTSGASVNANSIGIYDAFSTSGGRGYGSPWDYMGRICNSSNERDNVLTSDIIQTGKIYYINRYFSDSWH